MTSVIVTMLPILLLYCVSRSSASISTGMFLRQQQCPGKVVAASSCPHQLFMASLGQCAASCLQRASCVGFVRREGNNECELCVDTVNSACENARSDLGLEEFQLNACLTNGGQLTTEGSCLCPLGYDGSSCQIRMIDCQAWKTEGYPDGVYWIRPSATDEAIRVRCVMEWSKTTIMWHNDNTFSFYRTWAEYRDGFGDLSDNFWLGLNKIRVITDASRYCLSVQYILQNDTYFFIRYKGFRVSEESDNFALHFDNPLVISPVMGDCLADVNGKPFSTYDADHDDDVSLNCADRYRSGWWFGNCTQCNPTGVLTQPPDMLRQESPEEVFWNPALDPLTPRAVEMSLKRC